MASNFAPHFAAGCIVEFLQGNEVQTAWVMEDQGGRLRLFLPNRRETNMPSQRILPWAGPTYSAGQSRESMVEALLAHRERRSRMASEVVPVELWEMAQGEVARASASWFAELAYTNPDADTVAACGRALLQCKTHFHFQPPEFEIFDAHTVEVRLQAQEAARVREAMVCGGSEWFHRLWDAYISRKFPPDPAYIPEEPVRSRLVRMLLARIADPETVEDETLWKQVVRTLPDDPFLPLFLATAWGLVPEHYNYLLDRADYAPGRTWEKEFVGEIEACVSAVADASRMPPESDFFCPPFISIDGASTRDIDDAFSISEAVDGGWDVHLALACPAWFWDFESPLGRAVSHRATSLYLPECTCHMLPEALGVGAFSLFAGMARPALVVGLHVAPDGTPGEGNFAFATVRLAANLVYGDCEAVLEASESGAGLPAGNPASLYAEQLCLARDLGRVRLDWRIARGAVIIERPELDIHIEGRDGESCGSGGQLLVSVREAPSAPGVQLAVAELMILANAALASWAVERDVPLLFRTQDVAVPVEHAGIWRRASDIARVVRSLVGASVEVRPRPHAGMGLAAYSPVTSPLRRIADLMNEAQLMHVLQHGCPHWDGKTLAEILPRLHMRLDAAAQVQKTRPRYWKYLYIRQQSHLHGEACLWKAEVVEENDQWVSISLPEVQIVLRGKRSLFGEKVFPGQEVRVRLGRIDPLRGEASVLEVQEI